MQIVIDIPKESYEFAKECKARGCSKHNWNLTHDQIVLMVANGIPLPKGHGKMIDADDCKKNKRDFCEKSTRTNWYDTIDDLFDDAPTIIKADKESEE